MLVLVTGAAGKLGTAVCRELAAEGIEFRGVDLSTRKDLGHRVIVENVVNREVCYRLAEGCDAVVHLANRTNERAGTPQDIFGDNCRMNVNVFQAALDQGAQKIVFASSIQAITGTRRFSEALTKPTGIPYLPADGNTPSRPGNSYAASKVAGEVLLRCMVEHRGLSAGFSLRLPGLTMPEWFNWMRQHASPEHVWKEENLDELGAWLSFQDAARLIVACLKSNLQGYRCYFPAHESLRFGLSVADAISRYYSAAELRKPASELKGLVDISQITADTGWVPQDDFRKSVGS